MKDNKICSVVGCDTSKNKVMFKDEKFFCMRHYSQLLAYGEIRRIKNKKYIKKDDVCFFCGTRTSRMVNFSDGNIYCSKHYDHMRIYGYCKTRTIFTRNEFFIIGKITEVYLYNLDMTYKTKFIVDTEDLDKIIKYKWNLGSHGYPICTISGKCVHTVILKSKNKNVIDHVNRDKLDNRKCNLRICTPSQNAMNQKISKRSKTGIIGVSFDKVNNKWQASLRNPITKSNISKRFTEFSDGVKFRLELEKKYFGEFAPQKHLFEKYGVQ
jgi:transcription-repair coupling factor (superfamily II helicase)